MNAADVIGWYLDGSYFCSDCSPTNEEGENIHPIFASNETDTWSHCEECGALIPESLTSDGIRYTIEKIEEFLIRRAGRASVLRMWVTQLDSYALDQVERNTVSLAKNALDEENLKLAAISEIGRATRVYLCKTEEE